MTTLGFFGMLGKILSLLEVSLGNFKLGQLFISCAKVHLQPQNLPEDGRRCF